MPRPLSEKSSAEYKKEWHRAYQERNREYIKKQRKSYYESNKLKIAAQNKKNYEQNKDKYIARQSAYQKRYLSDPINRERRNVRRRERMRLEPEYAIKRRLHTRLKLAIRHNYEGSSSLELLGCSIKDFRAYVEKLFKPGMSWANWSQHGWHLDHIRPLNSFDLTDAAQAKIAFHYTNTQPKWAAENISKSDKHIPIEIAQHTRWLKSLKISKPSQPQGQGVLL